MSEITEPVKSAPKEKIDTILSLLNTEEMKFVFDIFIPSLQQEVKFKQLTTEQLKRILRTVIDSPIYNTEFILTLNSIIKENCTDKTIDVNKFTVYDKLFIFLKTRIDSISDTYNLKFTQDEISNNNLTNSAYSINLTEIYKKALNQNTVIETKDYQINEFTITCSLPTIEIENKFETELHKNIKTDINTPDDLREIIGETFVNEVSKFITYLKISEKIINLADYSFKERVKIVEGLPTTLVNKAIKYIEEYKEQVNQLLKVSINIKDTADNNVSLEKEIPYDATFYNI